MGETLTVTQGSEELLTIVITQADFIPLYPDTTSGFACCPDEPDPGNVYLQVFVQYEALGSGMSYGTFDWQVYQDNRQIADYPTYVSNGPTPELSSGDLPQGRTASGWMIYEVPATGRITLAYLPVFASNTEPVGEYLLRDQ